MLNSGDVSVGPATTQNPVVKFDGEICGGVLVENASDDFPQQKKLENLLPELRHPFRRKLRQLHSGNRWCLVSALQYCTGNFTAPSRRAARVPTMYWQAIVARSLIALLASQKGT